MLRIDDLAGHFQTMRIIRLSTLTEGMHKGIYENVRYSPSVFAVVNNGATHSLVPRNNLSWIWEDKPLMPRDPVHRAQYKKDYAHLTELLRALPDDVYIDLEN